MSVDNLILPSQYLATHKPAHTPIALHEGKLYSAEHMHTAVSFWVHKLSTQSAQHYALYTQDTYPFAVLLFALFHAGKQVWICGNNHAGTAEQLKNQCCELIGDWENRPAFDYCLDNHTGDQNPLSPLNPYETKLVIFTSGSTGQAKAIEKNLSQFELEIATLEQHWGEQLEQSVALATVSHQHIYGLLFKLLWPLSAGRCFHSQTYLTPEALCNHAQDITAYWVASPAHLKRLDADSPWADIADLSAVFSSGGVLLQESSKQIFQNSRQQIIEIYGSSETGGIAWRKQQSDWTLFEGMSLTPSRNGYLLQSPYLPSAEGVLLDDKLEIQACGRFRLQGRTDRIVKVEEKRLSLTELEQALQATNLVQEAYCFTVTNHRDLVIATLVLNEQGQALLDEQGRKKLFKTLRSALYENFDAVVLPRKWLIVSDIPVNAQSKIDLQLLTQLLDSGNHTLPQVQGFRRNTDSMEIALKVPRDLVYFPDHFANYPLLPGVVQITWVAHFGKLFFKIEQPFLNMEVIKFVKVIPPDENLKLKLNWKTDTGKLYFSFESQEGICSSGRLVVA